MKAREVLTEKHNQELDELLGPVGNIAGKIAKGLGTAGGVALKGLGQVAAAPLTGFAKGIGGNTGKALNSLGTGIQASTDAAGNAVKNVGQTAGNALGGTSPTTPGATPTGSELQQTFKPGEQFEHPKLGPLKILPNMGGQQGVTLDTMKTLGHNITIDPKDFTET
jgi:hypothetical protein